MKNGIASIALLLFAVMGSSVGCQTKRAGDSAEIEPTAAFSAAGESGASFYSYQAEPGTLPRPNIKPIFSRGGYIHPLKTPAGIVVTDDYPTNHVHHHGIWTAWTKTKFQGREPDFWNMGAGKGRVDFVRRNNSKRGMIAEHAHMDLTSGKPITALNEKWTMRSDRSAQANILDLEIEQTAATKDPLLLPQYHYGGLGFRGREEWNGKTNCIFLTSEGVTDRVKGNSTRARWCYVGGMVDGKQVGVVIMDHPSNFRHPQPMRLHPSEPFFCYAPSVLGDWEISVEKPYVAKYRFVTFDGSPDKATIEGWWKTFTSSDR